MSAFPVGLAVAALMSLLIIPNFGWRTLFAVGVIPALLLLFVRRYMPESVRYLLSKGRVAEAEATVDKIETGGAGPQPFGGRDRRDPEAAARRDRRDQGHGR